MSDKNNSSSKMDPLVRKDFDVKNVWENLFYIKFKLKFDFSKCQWLSKMSLNYFCYDYYTYKMIDTT